MLAPEFRGRDSGGVAEVFPEECLGREIQPRGNLFYAQRGLTQENLRLTHHIVFYPVACSGAVDRFQHRAEVFGRYRHLRGIELHIAV